MTDFRYLKAFLAASKHLNFAKAATDLRISASALTRQIALLEQSCGGQLFIRSTRKVTLTPLGTKLATLTENFDRQLLSLEGTSPLRIGCLQSVFEFFLLDKMRLYPHIFAGSMDITIGSPKFLEEMASAGQLDLLLTNIKPKAASGLSGFRLYKESLMWLGQAKSDRTIIFSAFEEGYAEQELKSPNRIRVNSFNAAMALASSGIGKTLVTLPAEKKTKTSKEAMQWIYLVIPQYKNLPPLLRKVVTALREKSPKAGQFDKTLNT